MELPSVLIFLGSWFSITGGVYMLFVMAEDKLEKEDRDYIAIWVMGADLPAEMPNWPSMFVALFDRVFTERHLSLECFFLSSVASYAAVVVIMLAVAIGDASTQELLTDNLRAILFFALFMNLLPDYLSLYETRLVLGFMAKSKGGLRTLALLFFDLVATALISFVWFVVIMLGSTKIMGGDTTFTEMAEMFGGGLTFSDDFSSLGTYIYIYSALFTSIWLWLYALSGFLVKAIATTRTGLHFLQEHLNIEEHPLRSMGFVLMLLVTVVYVVWGAALVL